MQRGTNRETKPRRENVEARKDKVKSVRKKQRRHNRRAERQELRRLIK